MNELQIFCFDKFGFHFIINNFIFVNLNCVDSPKKEENQNNHPNSPQDYFFFC